LRLSRNMSSDFDVDLDLERSNRPPKPIT
jgi:hypothetical protein